MKAGALLLFLWMAGHGPGSADLVLTVIGAGALALTGIGADLVLTVIGAGALALTGTGTNALMLTGIGVDLVLTVIGAGALVLALLQCLVALVNLLSRPWLPRLLPGDQPLVSVLIPARNEAAHIGALLEDLSRQPWTHLEILVFDDQSEDETATIIERAALSDQRIRLIRSSGLPNGWTGKNCGCHSLGAAAQGDYFLFLDADVRISGTLIGNAVAASRRYHIDLMTIFPLQIMESFGERCTVPVMNDILVSLLPLPLVLHSSRPSLAAANGQFMFFRAPVYREMQPHHHLRNIRVEDIAMARWMKKEKKKVACLLGDQRISCRMYHGFGEAVRGFSRSVTAFFGNSFLVALIYWMLTTLGFLPLLLAPDRLNALLADTLPSGMFQLPPGMLPLLPALLWLVMVLATRVLVALASRQNVLLHLGLLPCHQISLVMFIFKAIRNRINRGFEWKGRKVA